MFDILMNLWLVNMVVGIRLQASFYANTSYKLLKLLVLAKIPRCIQLENSLSYPQFKIGFYAEFILKPDGFLCKIIQINKFMNSPNPFTVYVLWFTGDV